MACVEHPVLELRENNIASALVRGNRITVPYLFPLEFDVGAIDRGITCNHLRRLQAFVLIERLVRRLPVMSPVDLVHGLARISVLVDVQNLAAVLLLFLVWRMRKGIKGLDATPRKTGVSSTFCPALASTVQTACTVSFTSISCLSWTPGLPY